MSSEACSLGSLTSSPAVLLYLTAESVNINSLFIFLHIFACRRRWTRRSSQCTIFATPPSPSWLSASLTRMSNHNLLSRSPPPPALFINLISPHSQHPKLYQPGQLSLFFNYKEFAVSAVQGFITSMLLFLLPMGE